MSLTTKFLNFSMKEQILITIIALTIFCICVILIVCCSLIYEILKKDYEHKKSYFYNRYKQYLESTFYFQSFYMMQYEEIIHRNKKQIWRIQESATIYENFRPLQNYSNYIINMTEEHNYTDLELKNQKDTPYFYILPLSSNNLIQDYIKNFSLVNYQTFANSLITHDIYQYFRMPGYGVALMDTPLFLSLNFSVVFSFDQNKMKNRKIILDS